MSEITLKLNRIEVKAPYASKTLELSTTNDNEILFQFSLGDDLCNTLKSFDSNHIANVHIVNIEGLTQIVKICNSVLYFEETEQEY